MSLCFTQHFCKNDVTVLEMKLFGVSGEVTTADHKFWGQPGKEAISFKGTASEQGRVSGSDMSVLRFSSLIVVQICSWSINKERDAYSIKLRSH